MFMSVFSSLKLFTDVDVKGVELSYVTTGSFDIASMEKDISIIFSTTFQVKAPMD
jgi:hypothetical protein